MSGELDDDPDRGMDDLVDEMMAEPLNEPPVDYGSEVGSPSTGE